MVLSFFCAFSESFGLYSLVKMKGIPSSIVLRRMTTQLITGPHHYWSISMRPPGRPFLVIIVPRRKKKPVLDRMMTRIPLDLMQATTFDQKHHRMHKVG